MIYGSKPQSHPILNQPGAGLHSINGKYVMEINLREIKSIEIIESRFVMKQVLVAKLIWFAASPDR